MKEYNQENVAKARKLRKDMTPWERKLWYDFLRSYPVRFYRQKALGNYIVDFYAAKAGLVIELDGGGHFTPDGERYDRERTRWLEAMGVMVFRVINPDVDRNFLGVCEEIDRIIRQRLRERGIEIEF
ncbi:MAG: DUF559 domain-containing protein [Ruminococcaceae bacterium]|nr:DUF559 domain-containing protein [Oscillospiraceae bacterium]